MTSRLQHPTIVPVLDSGKYHEWLYLGLPYMDGDTLRARPERDKQLPIEGSHHHWPDDS